jgi:hypothetical protein
MLGAGVPTSGHPDLSAGVSGLEGPPEHDATIAATASPISADAGILMDTSLIRSERRRYRRLARASVRCRTLRLRCDVARAD